MPQLNLQQLLKGEALGTIIEKINENFSQLSINGGGPQGKKGFQGPPGLPGLRGLSGPTGDNGSSGIKVTLVPEDENWGNLYEGQTSGAVSANAAIDEGFSVGDIWIDNNTGYFYVIVEDTPGNYLFEPYPLSASVLSSDIWSPDNQSAQSNIRFNGIRNSNRFATISLTAEQSTVPGSQTAATQEFNENDQLYQEIYGFSRSSFKLSIDNVQADVPLGGTYERFTEAYDTGSIPQLPFNISGDDISPIVYYGAVKNAALGSFGLLLSKLPDEDIKYLILSGGDKASTPSHILNDTDYLGTTGSHIYLSPGNTADRNISATYLNNTGNSEVDTSFWFNFVSQADSSESPRPGTNDFLNKGGIQLQKFGTNLSISLWTNDSISSGPDHVLKATHDGKVYIGEFDTDVPGSILSVRGNLGVGEDYFNIPAPVNGAIIQGDTGVGTFVPTAKLHVGGNLKVDAVINLPGHFLTWNSGTSLVTHRTAAETRLDIGAVGGSGEATQVAYWNSPNTLAGEDNLWWDPTNGRLGIGTNSPTQRLHVNGGDILLSGGGLRQILSSTPLLIRTTTNNQGIEINTGNIETGEPNQVDGTDKIVIRGRSVDSDGVGIYIYTAEPPAAVSTEVQRGDIKIRPGNLPPNATVVSNAGVIVLERRVQVLEPSLEDSAAVGVNVTLASESYNWLRALGDFSTPADNKSTSAQPPSQFFFPSTNYDRYVTITLSNSLMFDTIGFFLQGAGGNFTSQPIQELPTTTRPVQTSMSVLIPACTSFAIRAYGEDTTQINYGVRWRRFGRTSPGCRGISEVGEAPEFIAPL